MIQPWSIDMFSLGAILLEILTGFPLWLSLKGRVETNTYDRISYGLFAVKGKDTKQILKKQIEVIRNLKGVLDKYNCFINDPEMINLLKRMLDLNPMTRISPTEALKHPFLNK